MTELSRKKEIFLANYLMTGNVKKASEMSDITRKTAYNYLNDATFKRLLYCKMQALRRSMY